MNYSQIFDGATFLVTGGAGFIGSNVIEELLSLENVKVKCLDNLSTGKIRNVDLFNENKNYTFVCGDVRDFDTCKECCEGADFVLHLAGIGSVPRSILQPILYQNVNVKGTLNMLEAAKIANVKKFVFSSSSSVYGDSEGAEKSVGKEGKPLSPYALTKLAAEHYCRLYCELYGFPTCSLRYFNVFGKRQSAKGDYAAVIPKFFSAALCGYAPEIFGDGTQSRDFTHVKNVVNANLLAATSTSVTNGKSFNVGCGKATSLNELLRLICAVIGKSIQPIYSESRRGDVRNSCADLSLSTSLLGYLPIVPIEEGLSQTAEFYRGEYA